MEPLFVAAVFFAMTMRMTSADDESCEVYPVFKSKEKSLEFFAKVDWSVNEEVYHEESVFSRRRHCPVRVRIDEDSTKIARDRNNGSQSKGSNSKKNSNSQRKLKGSKNKRKKEKRKRFKKKKKGSQKTVIQT